jgi:hypothetical protein
MRIHNHNPPSTAAPIYRRTHIPPHPYTAAPSYHRAHLPPYTNITRTATPSISGERVRQWQEWDKWCTDDAGWHCRQLGSSHSLTAPHIHCCSHPPPKPTAARILISSASGERVRHWQCYVHICMSHIKDEMSVKKEEWFIVREGAGRAPLNTR